VPGSVCTAKPQRHATTDGLPRTTSRLDREYRLPTAKVFTKLHSKKEITYYWWGRARKITNSTTSHIQAQEVALEIKYIKSFNKFLQNVYPSGNISVYRGQGIDYRTEISMMLTWVDWKTCKIIFLGFVCSKIYKITAFRELSSASVFKKKLRWQKTYLFCLLFGPALASSFYLETEAAPSFQNVVRLFIIRETDKFQEDNFANYNVSPSETFRLFCRTVNCKADS
jgi:hypothetical protein